MIIAPRVLGPCPAPLQMELAVHDGLPGLDVFEDVLFLPPLPPSPHLRPEINGRGGMFDRDGAVIEAGATTRRGGRHALEPLRYGEAETRLDEEVLYLGFLMPQYGHALLESFARQWALDHLPWPGRLLVHAEDPDILRSPGGSFIRELLEVFGIDAGRILIPAAPTRIRRVHVPWPAFSFEGYVHRCYPGPFERAARRWAGNVQRNDRPLYMAKTRSAMVRPGSEEHLIQRLEREGFVIAHPQDLSIKEQIRLVNAHRSLAGPIGSALHNHMFSLRPLAVTALWAGQPYWDTLAITTAAKANPLTLVVGTDRAARGNDWDMDVEAVLGHLDAEGLLGLAEDAAAPVPALPGWRDAIAAALRYGPLAALRERREAREILDGGLFDEAYYLAANPDVARSGMNPLLHYLRHGRGEGRAPRQDAAGTASAKRWDA